MSLMWTKTSGPPWRSMNPKPFRTSNHLTVPLGVLPVELRTERSGVEWADTEGDNASAAGFARPSERGPP